MNVTNVNVTWSATGHIYDSDVQLHPSVDSSYTYTKKMTDGHGKREEQRELRTTAVGGIKSRDYFYGIENTKCLIRVKSVKR